MSSSEGGRVYLTARQVCSRYGGISDMTLWRWLRDPDLNFPPPLLIQGRRYFSEASLDDFDEAQVEAQANGELDDVGPAPTQLGHNGGPPLDDDVGGSDRNQSGP